MKTYFVDTNILIDHPDAVEILSDDNQNKVFISYHVLNELDKLKKDPQKSYKVSQVIKNLKKNLNKFTIPKINPDLAAKSNSTDNKLLSEIINLNIPEIILVTADEILQIKATSLSIKSENLKRANPFTDIENGDYSGVFESINEDTKLVNNCFYWDNGKLYFYRQDQEAKSIHYTNTVWNVKPKNVYQNMFLELMLNPDINVISIQSPAGCGKSFLSLAAAFYHVLEKKNYRKIYITKALYEIGERLGFLPGDLNEKLAPYMKYIDGLIGKLTELRPAAKIFNEKNEEPSSLAKFNNKKLEILPINYVRGMNIEDSFVIIDEIQNLSRDEVRTLLSRFGENCKCICIGDTSQIDNPYLNKHNNGLNWILRKFKGEKDYAHLVLKSDKYRGPICELVVRTGL